MKHVHIPIPIAPKTDEERHDRYVYTRDFRSARQKTKKTSKMILVMTIAARKEENAGSSYSPFEIHHAVFHLFVAEIKGSDNRQTQRRVSGDCSTTTSSRKKKHLELVTGIGVVALPNSASTRPHSRRRKVE